MKMLAAICPLCEEPIALGEAFELRAPAIDEALLCAHLEQHTLLEWAQCMQGLRNQLADRDELRRIPYWAMPQA
jgi:hypothetical protein